MMHYKEHPKKPLFTDPKEKEVFMSLFDDFDNENHIKIAKALFVDGMTMLETAELTDYSVRQIERLKGDILKVALKRAMKKHIPQKPAPHIVKATKIKIGNVKWGKGTTIYKCPCCDEFISRIYDYCYKCGQALDWSDSK